MTMTRQLSEQVNDTIITALERQMVLGRSDHGFPRNVWSRRRYGGMEAILLMLACDRQGFTSCWWGTKSEWETLGGSISEGPGTEIVVGRGKSLHALTVYNLCQISGDFPVSRNERHMVDYALVERIIAGTKADIRFTDEPVAEYYYPQEDSDGDYIKMCRKERFERGPGGAPSYYHSLFHELAHMSEVPLDWYGPQDVRELRAEIAADFLCTELAIPNYPYRCRRNLHKHLAVWIKRMRRSPGMIFKVARDAAQAVDFILGCSALAEPRHRAE